MHCGGVYEQKVAQHSKKILLLNPREAFLFFFSRSPETHTSGELKALKSACEMRMFCLFVLAMEGDSLFVSEAIL